MARHRISRRTALVTGAGAAVAGILAAGGYELVEAGTLPGKYRLAKLTGACGGPPGPPAGPHRSATSPGSTPGTGART